MAAPDDTELTGFINSNFPDPEPGKVRRISAGAIRFVLFKLKDWVKTGINNNLSTWLRTSDNQPGGANAEAVYRTGLTEFKGGIMARAQTPNANALATLPHGGFYPLQILGSNGGPAFLEFHQPGYRIDQVGVDTDGKLKIHPWGESKAYPFLIDTLTAAFILAGTLANRKIVLYDAAGNEHQFYGFGINDSVLRYQVPNGQSSHIFYAGTSALTSKELVRIQGDGKVGINSPTPTARLSVEDANPTDAIIARFHNTVIGGNGARIRLELKNYGQWDIGLAGGINAFVIIGWNGSGMSERVRITEAGQILLGTDTSNGRDLLQVNGPISGKVLKVGANPGSGDLAVDTYRVQKNTANGEVRLWVNDGGTMKSTLLS